MHFELGPAGVGLLVALSLVFGVFAHVVARGATRWLWLIGATAFFLGGLFASEVVWGALTANDIQPIIDGLAFDESLLGGVVLGVPVVLVTWYVARRGRMHPPMTS